MRKKELKLIITFYTTSEAMAAEAICREEQIKGRLIPVPREISAECGLSFCTEVENQGKIRDVFSLKNIQFQLMGQYWI